MVILWSKPENSELIVSFCHFVVMDQFAGCKFVALKSAIAMTSQTLIQNFVASSTAKTTLRESAGDTIRAGS